MIRELIQLDNQDVDPRKLGGRALGLMQGSLCSQCLTVSAAHFDGFFFFFFFQYFHCLPFGFLF